MFIATVDDKIFKIIKSCKSRLNTIRNELYLSKAYYWLKYI